MALLEIILNSERITRGILYKLKNGGTVILLAGSREAINQSIIKTRGQELRNWKPKLWTTDCRRMGDWR